MGKHYENSGLEKRERLMKESARLAAIYHKLAEYCRANLRPSPDPEGKEK
jgi:hypothetical protein